MISRIRIEAFGPSAADVEAQLQHAAQVADDGLKLDALQGEQVIERDCSAPADSHYSFKGRLILHPNVAPLEGGNWPKITTNGGMTITTQGV